MDPLIMSLSKNELFAGLSIGELENIFSSTRHFLEKYKKGEVVRLQNSKYDDLLIVLSGEIVAEMHDQNGKVVKLDIFNPGYTIGPGIAFRKDNRLPVTLVSRADSTLLNLPRKTLLDLCQENRKFLMNLLEDIGSKIDFLAKRIRTVEFRTIKQKIAKYILELSESSKSDTIEMKLSREELSEMFGVARPSLSRVLSELAKMGIIDLENRSIRIIRREELEEMLQENLID